MTDNESTTTFEDMGLDPRLLKAMTKLGWTKPTLVQSSCIPLALEGKDILARAKTGSGKTAAYGIPLLHSLLSSSSSAPSTKPTVRSVILVPTAELCSQTQTVIQALAQYTKLKVKNLSGDVSKEIQAAMIQEGTVDVLITTPARLALHLKNGIVRLSEDGDGFQVLAIDEADLTLSFGYSDDLKLIVEALPRVYQGFIMSATLTPAITQLKTSFLHTPALLTLEEEGSAHPNLKEYGYLCAGPDDKFLMTFALLRLNVVRPKVLLFVNSIQRCFQLKIFLDRMSLKVAVLNSELPLESRLDIIHQFNNGTYGYLIATDELFQDSENAEEVKTTEVKDEEDEDEEKGNKSRKRKRQDKDYGVSRGVDFKAVATVINVDYPLSTKSYIHRIGRTARGGASGISVTLIGAEEEEEAWGKMQTKRQLVIDNLPFEGKLLDSFRYRCEDVMRSVTKNTVKQARIEAVKRELLNSKKLKKHFSANPDERKMVEHAGALVTSTSNDFSNLRHIPGYLLPEAVRKDVQKEAKSLPRKYLVDHKKKQSKKSQKFIRHLRGLDTQDHRDTKKSTDRAVKALADKNVRL
eukprot:TRINITY_DN6135_c0_g1_i1.p1 TRINITY_DN6135_c0_g1~~TRINITY_DN6135_c0_g1_i1.p1  ORF type:complete len:579 (-),score=137.71 TRINITY_DN6135_c0_g1_i1:28-1764(-)